MRELLAKMALAPRQLLRTNVPPYLEKGLDDLTLSDDALIAAMLADPILINRPIAVTEKEHWYGVRFEKVLPFLCEAFGSPADGEFRP